MSSRHNRCMTYFAEHDSIRIRDAVEIHGVFSYAVYKSWKEGLLMPQIRPLSDLRKYDEVLEEVSANGRVFLTCDGRKRYAVVEMREYEAVHAGLRLMAELARGESAGQGKGWQTLEEVQSEFSE